MTRGSDTRRVRRKRGRPPQDERDQLAIDVAAALRSIYGLGPQVARDLAVALLEGEEGPTIELSDGRWRTQFEIVGATIKGRSGHLQRKSSGKLKRNIRPRQEIVAVLAVIIRGRDERSIHRLLTSLLALTSPTKLRRAIERLSTGK